MSGKTKRPELKGRNKWGIQTLKYPKLLIEAFCGHRDFFNFEHHVNSMNISGHQCRKKCTKEFCPSSKLYDRI